MSKILIIKCNEKGKHEEMDAEVQKVSLCDVGKGVGIVNVEFAGRLGSRCFD